MDIVKSNIKRSREELITGFSDKVRFLRKMLDMAFESSEPSERTQKVFPVIIIDTNSIVEYK